MNESEAQSAVTLHPIGIVRSPFSEQRGTPIQPRFSPDAVGRIELDPSLEPALKDLDGFERIWVLYVFDRAKPVSLEVTPYMDSRTHGLFATRAPSRPNPVGMSSVRVTGIEGSTIHVTELDVLDGTPVLDIKPYVARFDAYPDAREGWLTDAETRPNGPVADSRFASDKRKE